MASNEEEGENKFRLPKDNHAACHTCSEFHPALEELRAHEERCTGVSVKMENERGRINWDNISGLSFSFPGDPDSPLGRVGPQSKKAKLVKLGAEPGGDVMPMVSPYSPVFFIVGGTQGCVLDLFHSELKDHYRRMDRPLRENAVYHLFKTAMSDDGIREALLRIAKNNFQGQSPVIRDGCVAAALKGDIRPFDVLAKCWMKAINLDFQGQKDLAASFEESLHQSDASMLTLMRSNVLKEGEVELDRYWKKKLPDNCLLGKPEGKILDLSDTVSPFRNGYTPDPFWDNFFDVLLRFDQLVDLLLNKNHIGDRQCRHIAELMTRGHLIRLSLRSNEIGDDGAQLLAHGLKGSHSQGSSHCQVNVLDLQMNTIGSKGWEAIAGALCVDSTIAATSEKSNHTLASLVHPGAGPSLVHRPESFMGGSPALVRVRDLLVINENDCNSAAREKVWRVWVHPDDKWGAWGKFLEHEFKRVPHILAVFNRSIPPPEEGRVERHYRPSLSALWSVVKVLPIEEIFGRPSPERKRWEIRVEKLEDQVKKLKDQVERLQAELESKTVE